MTEPMYTRCPACNGTLILARALLAAGQAMRDVLLTRSRTSDLTDAVTGWEAAVAEFKKTMRAKP